MPAPRPLRSKSPRDVHFEGKQKERRQRVRYESSGFNPNSVAGLQLDLDFGDPTKLFTDTTLTTPVSADNDVIKGVQDKSTAGRNFTEATNGPAYKINQWGTRSGALFDATNDKLAGPTNTVIAAQPSTCFVVFKATAAGENRITDAGTGAGRNIIGYTGTTYQLYAGTASLTGGSTNTATHVIVAIFNGASSVLYADGGAATISGNPGADGWGAVANTALLGSDGAAAVMNGTLGRILSYNGALSAANINTIGSGLAAVYNTTWTAVS